MNDVRRPPTTWYWVTALCAAIGVLGAVGWGVLTFQHFQDRIDAMPRTAVPGQVTVDVAHPHGLTLYYEDATEGGAFVVRADNLGSGSAVASPVEVSVTDPSGAPVPTAGYRGDLRYDVGGRAGRAVATFDAAATGTYTVQVSGDVPADAQVAVGRLYDLGLLANAAGAVLLFVGTLLAATIVLIVVLVKRSSRPLADEATDREYAGIG